MGRVGVRVLSALNIFLAGVLRALIPISTLHSRPRDPQRPTPFQLSKSRLRSRWPKTQPSHPHYRITVNRVSFTFLLLIFFLPSLPLYVLSFFLCPPLPTPNHRLPSPSTVCYGAVLITSCRTRPSRRSNILVLLGYSCHVISPFPLQHLSLHIHLYFTPLSFIVGCTVRMQLKAEIGVKVAVFFSPI